MSQPDLVRHEKLESEARRMLLNPLHHIPDWHGDETLYSWSATMHRLLGCTTKETGKRIFGASHAYKEWAASSQLNHLVWITDGSLGDSRSILLNRTVLSAYYPFLRPDQRQDFDVRTASAKRTPWLTRFGMRASSLDGSEMRWCCTCAKKDVFQWGMPRWRLPHQMPGAWWCVEHDLPLNRLTHSRAEWVVPDVSETTPNVMLSLGEREALRILSKLAGSLIGHESVNLVSIKRALLSRLRDIGVVASMKPVSPINLQHWFATTKLATAIKQVAPSHYSVFDRPWIYETLLSRRSNHPLLWLVLWAATFEGLPIHEVVHEFHAADATILWQEDGQGLLWVEDRFQSDAKVQTIVRTAHTIEDAARQLNVSVTTVRRYMKAAQCAPKFVRGEDWRKVRKKEAISKIESMIHDDPAITRTDIRLKCKGEVSWLSKWEPELLASLFATVPETRERQLSLGFAA